MNTHNICFHGEIRKIFTGYPPLSRPMGRGKGEGENDHRYYFMISLYES